MSSSGTQVATLVFGHNWTDVIGKWEGYYKAQVMAETWGYPEPNVKYHGWVVWTHGIDGDLTMIDRSEDFGCDPFSYGDLMDWLGEKACPSGPYSQHKWKTKKGHVYRFDGYYIKHKNGNYRFTGKIKEVFLSKTKPRKGRR